MIEGIHGMTRRLAVMALDACEMRQNVLAANIANSGVDGYQPLRLNFEEQLSGLRTAVAEGASDETIAAMMTGVAPRVEARPVDPILGNGLVNTNLRLDEEMTLLSQNSLQYEAVLTALAHESALARIAVTGEP